MDIRDELYYKIARKGSLDKGHPSFEFISKYGLSANRILDIGCGEGTRISSIKNDKAEKIGVDQSSIAISLAKKQYPQSKFIQIKNKLPFPDSYFDFVFSAFVLEHTTKSEDFLKEAIRVLSPCGILLFVAPNFGSPNRASPNNKQNRLKKLYGGFNKDVSLLFAPKTKKLNWQEVTSQKTYDRIDSDTTVEPYLLSLEKYLSNLGVEKVKSSSLWSQEKGLSLFQILFRALGLLNIPPFSYWGPHILYVGKKYG
jgi:ubiquinone/menaquinone biosynthesis C-methylase UbiE